MTRVALCADSETLCHPEIIGLEGVNLGSQAWLAAFSRGQDIRDYVRKAPCVEEAWAVSADDMEAINVAAALRQDCPNMPIYLAVFSLSGSTLSRARAAGVTGVLSKQALAHRFAQEKKRRALMAQDRGGGEVGSQMPETLCAAVGTSEPQVDAPSPPVASAASISAVPASESATMGVDAPAPAEHADAPASAPAPAEHAVSSPSAPASASAPASPSTPTFVPAPSAEFASSSASAKLAQTSSDTAHNVEVRHTQGASRVVHEPKSAAGAFVLTVASGSGGVGKSAVSVAAACLAAKRGFRTLLLDCDLQFGDAHALLGKKKVIAIEDVVDSEEVLGDIPIPEDKPAIICSPRRLELAEVLVEKLPSLIDALAERFDVIVVNTGCSWGEQHAMLLERSANTLLLVDQRASSVRTCIHALDLCKRCGIATSSFTFALNRCERGALFSSVDVSCALQGAHVLELREGGPVVEELLGAGMAFELMEQGNAFCESVDDLLDEILPLRESGHSGRSGSRSGRSARQGKAASSRKRSRRGFRGGGRREGEDSLGADHIALQEEGDFFGGNVRPFFQFGSWAFRRGEVCA